MKTIEVTILPAHHDLLERRCASAGLGLTPGILVQHVVLAALDTELQREQAKAAAAAKPKRRKRRKMSEETKQKMREAAQRREAKKKALAEVVDSANALTTETVQ